ncbi:chromatin modification-related protein EAF7-like [Phoenix dactylifera]|uniref:Chromatin modification-related protein EAF7-like n=1 Tax=Phoenix dactylifera TaxID=42345 RepID=A0A8B8J926_PHODC|nr:chromatin modification-related protein EAF7-like [Phoenix dactylifera]
MESEAPVRDERDEEHVDEMKADDDIKNVHEVNVSQSKNVEETHEGEKIKAEGSQNVEASITESEKKTEDKENDTVVEQVKTEEEDDKSTVTPSVEVEVESQVNAADTPKPSTEAVEKPAEDTEASKMQEKKTEATKEPTVEETAIEEIESKEESPVASAAPSSTPVGPSTTFTVFESTPDAIITPSVEVSELKEQVGALVPDVIEKKDFDPDADAGKEEFMKEESGSAAIKVEAIHTTSATEVAEQVGKREVHVEEEKPEKTMEFKKPTISEKTKTYDAAEVVEASGALGDVEVIKEKKDESFVGDGATFVETSRDLDAVGGEGNVKAPVRELEGDSKEAMSELKPAEAIETIKTEGSGDKKEETVKADDQSLVEPTKEGGDTNTDVEASEQKVIAKTSQRQSNNIISKVKRSIVKVRKAIVGKSPSSKNMSSKGKDELKEK